MIKRTIIILVLLIFTLSVTAQEYDFKTIVDLQTSDVKSQGKTGTCWSFATSSFLESEIYRMTGKSIDVAEMYIVRSTYEKKAWNYVMRQGKTQLSEGGLAHDVINAIASNGLVPQSAFTDIFGNEKIYSHTAVIPDLKEILNSYIKNDIDSAYPNWQTAITPILDNNIGTKPSSFTYENQTYSPQSFQEYTKIVPENYVTLTSFTHEKLYSKFVLNIPDNFSNGSFYNVSLDELAAVAKLSLEKGYSISLDVDVSEKTFSAKHGIAVLPKEETDTKVELTQILPEVNVTESFRQKEFENYNTTDDHLMHIIGMVKDQKGNIYYKVKNSWGAASERVGNNGYIYMSVPYFKLKTISILLHKDALSQEIKTKLDL